jgi:hypothetical protein
MTTDVIAFFIPILRARLECGNLVGLGPWPKDGWYIADVAAEAHYVLREIDRFGSMNPIDRAIESSARRDVARRLRNLRDGLTEWDRRC